MCAYIHKHVRKPPKHPLSQPGTLLLKDKGWASTRVPDGGQAADQWVSRAWAWQGKSVTGLVWGRNESGNHDFFCRVDQ